jgi:uncharacterized protein (DUF924 family)
LSDPPAPAPIAQRDVVASSRDVVTFWQGAGADKWFTKDSEFDEAVRARFLPTYRAAAAGELGEWERMPEGALALLIVLDQFPRNMFRGRPETYAADPLARAVADRALKRGHDRAVAQELRTFFYLPFMHSETLADQERALALYRALGDEESLRYAQDHADIIRRFGRFPHRNRVLGRASMPEEQAFLAAGGFAG